MDRDTIPLNKRQFRQYKEFLDKVEECKDWILKGSEDVKSDLAKVFDGMPDLYHKDGYYVEVDYSSDFFLTECNKLVLRNNKWCNTFGKNFPITLQLGPGFYDYDFILNAPGSRGTIPEPLYNELKTVVAEITKDVPQLIKLLDENLSKAKNAEGLKEYGFSTNEDNFYLKNPEASNKMVLKRPSISAAKIKRAR